MKKYFMKVPSEKGINVVDTESAGMKHLGFKKLVLGKGDEYRGNSEGWEMFLVILSGKCDVKVGDKEFKGIGGRKNVFSGKPFSVYVPPKHDFHVKTEDFGGVEVALAMARVDESDIEPYLITPDEVVEGKWGVSNYSRKFHQIAVDDKHPAVKLMIGETFTPSGNWSTYPPHKHEKDNLPREVFLEEIYYYRVDHPDGWGVARHYTDDGDIDELYLIRDDTIHLIPKGYHTVVAAPGFTVYYLWFLAGNYRVQAPVVDKTMAFVDLATKMIKNIEDNLSV